MSLTTKRALAASLKKLLAAKPLDKITIRDIVEDCGVNRQTFYYHFHDVYDLMEWIFMDEAARVLGERRTPPSGKEAFLSLFRYMEENRAFVINSYNSISREHLEAYLKKMSRPIIYDLAISLSKDMDISPENLNFVVDIYVFAMVGLTLDWVGSNMRSNYADHTDKFLKLVDGSLENALRKFAG
jgi:probable dihydroxyacetone kinase regulator